MISEKETWRKLFLCSPYTHDNPTVVRDRVKKINAAAAELMKQGHIVFSPISHSHYIAMQEDLPTTFEFWQVQNHAFIDWCDAVFVMDLDGWIESKGVADEIEYAESIGKKIVMWMVADE